MSFNKKIKKDGNWDIEIRPVSGWKGISLKEILEFKGLIYLLVKRDLVVFYKQTILGPLWYIIQPVFNSLVFTFIFGTIASIPTDGAPPFLFYLAGSVIWGYFAHAFTLSSQVFVTNAAVFGKVYYPRITVPISISISSVVQFLVQFVIFLGFFFYYKSNGFESDISFLTPLIILICIIQIAILSIGFGMVVSAITARYRDLVMALTFTVQLWMYLTPVVYPLSEVPEEYKTFILLNPMTVPVELFKSSFFGVYSLSSEAYLISWVITFIVFILGSIIFNRIDKTFMDTV